MGLLCRSLAFLDFWVSEAGGFIIFAFTFFHCLLLPIPQCVCFYFSISCFISLVFFWWVLLLDLVSLRKTVGLRLGSSITGSMHSRIVLDIYLGCKPARVKVFSGLFKHFFPLMYCLPWSCNYTNWERSLEFPRLFWVTAAISVWGISVIDLYNHVFLAGVIVTFLILLILDIYIPWTWLKYLVLYNYIKWKGNPGRGHTLSQDLRMYVASHGPRGFT